MSRSRGVSTSVSRSGNGLGSGCSSSSSGILLALAEDITVVIGLAHEAVRQILDGLLLCQTVDAAVVVVFDR